MAHPESSFYSQELSVGGGVSRLVSRKLNNSYVTSAKHNSNKRGPEGVQPNFREYT